MLRNPTDAEVFEAASVEQLYYLTRASDGTFVIHGELDLAVAPDVLSRLAAQDGDVALDCSGLTYIDAAGLRLFLAVRRHCDKYGAKLTIVNPSRCVRRLLDLTGLGEMFSITDR